MPMIIYKLFQANPQQFVDFWKLRYKDPKENLYRDNIGQALNEKRILELYQWKNGTPLSAGKSKSVHYNFVERRDELEQLQPTATANDFLARFSNGGAIWRIFWLHCWQHDRFPIYDQHVHRAMAFIENGVCEENSQYDDRRKIKAYIDRYLPFHAKFAAFKGRTVDKALWAFGKFIKDRQM
ncbi:MAG: hypothetical protein FD159_2388 [Syntrophaceae bacterium]|nr:MAG: hypothetical protein FD159_2388 [Syntrophaceae bacterium]